MLAVLLSLGLSVVARHHLRLRSCQNVLAGRALTPGTAGHFVCVVSEASHYLLLLLLLLTPTTTTTATTTTTTATSTSTTATTTSTTATATATATATTTTTPLHSSFATDWKHCSSNRRCQCRSVEAAPSPVPAASLAVPRHVT